MARRAHFQPALFGFLAELRDHNSREWFEANRDRYRSEVQEPLLRFIADFAEPLAGISPSFLADPRPSGGSMFRIYRDVRFARDKSPYKTHAAAQFRHRHGRDAHTPCFYLHLEPGNVFAGAGLWHPPAPALKAVREAIVEAPDHWRSVTQNRAFTARHTLGGDTLSRAPRGFDADHPLVEDLKRKDFISYCAFTERQACAPDFLDRYAASCQAAARFVRFVTEAVGHTFEAPSSSVGG
jgi:uncharacterized protein (TIGR02453 family)